VTCEKPPSVDLGVLVNISSCTEPLIIATQDGHRSLENIQNPYTPLMEHLPPSTANPCFLPAHRDLGNNSVVPCNTQYILNQVLLYKEQELLTGTVLSAASRQNGIKKKCRQTTCSLSSSGSCDCVPHPVLWAGEGHSTLRNSTGNGFVSIPLK